jgi:lipoprotein-releasing system permease protein
MPYEIFLASRYLRSRHKRRLTRVTAAAAILGIAMGVGALIVAFSLSNGFRDEMQDKILQGTAHLSVLRSDSIPIADYLNVSARIRKVDGVVSASATTYDGAVATGPKGSAYAVLRGAEKEDGQSASFQRWMREGSFASLFEQQEGSERRMPPAVMGAELATRMGLVVGDEFQIIPASVSSGGHNPVTRRLRVIGIFRSGLFEYDSTWIYIPLETATAFSGGTHAASVISVQVSNTDDVKRIAEKVRAALGTGYTTVDWQQANQPLFTALALERRMGLFIIGLIIAIAALNITTTLILVVVERRRDIAILRALGAMPTGITVLFMIEGAVIGAAGALAGVLLGLLACAVGNHYKLVSLPADVYSISNVPLNAKASEILVAALIAFSLSVLATIYPARSAARLRPVETLRDSA